MCESGAQDSGESDVDCGGGRCDSCADGRACEYARDCQSGVCSGGVCGTPRCDDHRMNGAESDVDCGGKCGPCALGQDCKTSQDCAVGLCNEFAVCALPGCDLPVQAEPGDMRCEAAPQITVLDAALRANGLARDPQTGTLYVAVSSTDARFPQRVVALRPRETAPAWLPHALRT